MSKTKSSLDYLLSKIKGAAHDFMPVLRAAHMQGVGALEHDADLILLKL